MKRLIGLAICTLLWPMVAMGQGLQWEAAGGQQLTIRAKAEQQQWIVLGGKILVAAVAEGKLVVQEFAWPPGPGPNPPDPGPNPPDPGPQPVKHWQVAFFVESNDLDNLTTEQQTMLASLLVRKDLETKGHRLVGVFDPDVAKTVTDAGLKAWMQVAKQAPCVAIAPLEGGQIQVFPLPANKEALWKLLENPFSKPKTEPPAGCPGGRCVR